MDDIVDRITSVFSKGEKVLVAMSGGVDSSVTAWAAKQAGCDVQGVTLQMFDTDIPFWEDAHKVADMIGIKWHLADYRRFFNEDIISPYIATYKRGETPNPCSMCNRKAKTKYLFDEMQQAGCNRIATGHYVNTAQYDGGVVITKIDNPKEQSYYMSLMDPFHIGFMIYPLSQTRSKDEVRALANELGLPVANKRDSYEACFLKGEDYREYLVRKIGEGRAGNFIYNNEVVGTHNGTFMFTVGQRKGLEINREEQLHVKKINPKTGDIELVEKKELFLRGVRLRDCVFHKDEPVMRKATAILRNKMPGGSAPCLIELQFGNTAVLLFDEPQFAPAPGQVTTVYDKDRVIGGGVVESVF